MYKGDDDVGSVLVEATETTPTGTSIDWFVSTDGGTVFQPITLGTTSVVTNGKKLILKASLISTHLTNFAEIEDITINYIFV